MNICKKCALRIVSAVGNLVVTILTLGFYHNSGHIDKED